MLLSDTVQDKKIVLCCTAKAQTFTAHSTSLVKEEKMPAAVKLKINKTLTVIIVGKSLLIQVQYSFWEATCKSKKDVPNAVVNYANLLRLMCQKHVLSSLSRSLSYAFSSAFNDIDHSGRALSHLTQKRAGYGLGMGQDCQSQGFSD